MEKLTEALSIVSKRGVEQARLIQQLSEEKAVLAEAKRTLTARAASLELRLYEERREIQRLKKLLEKRENTQEFDYKELLQMPFLNDSGQTEEWRLDP